MNHLNAPLTILTFKAGTLRACFPDCIKTPGIYGTIFWPIELLDKLIIEKGSNSHKIRFAAQFPIDQATLDKLTDKGVTINITENLSLSFEHMPQEKEI